MSGGKKKKADQEETGRAGRGGSRNRRVFYRQPRNGELQLPAKKKAN